MQRRHFMLSTAALLTAPALAPVRAHHGWSSFEQDKPVYVRGRIKSVRWQNPHAEAVVEVPAGLSLPADIASRSLPAQQQRVDAAGVLQKVRATTLAGEWELEFAPLSRMQAWGLGEPLKAGAEIECIGYTGPTLNQGRLMRVEYLFVNGKAHGLRSLPAS